MSHNGLEVNTDREHIKMDQKRPARQVPAELENKVVIRNLAGEEVAIIPVSQETTVKKIKNRLHFITDIPADRMKLVFGEVELQERDLAASLGGECELQLVYMQYDLETRRNIERQFVRDQDSVKEVAIWYLIDVEWLQSWKNFVSSSGPLPGPICNDSMLDAETGNPCPGLEKIMHYRGLNEAVWKYFVECYGGGPAIRRRRLDLYAPPVLESPLDARRDAERKFLARNDSTEESIWYLIDKEWLKRWKDFAARDGPLPGPICNESMLDIASGRPRLGLEKITHYRGLNETVWKYFVESYGGGPAIRRHQIDIYAEPCQDSQVGAEEAVIGLGNNI